MDKFLFKLKVLIPFLFSGLLFLNSTVNAQTPGTLTFSVNLTSHNGSYGLDHFVAIWIENGTNTFVKTKLKLADAHGTTSHLLVWKASSASNVVDAVTGASLTDYSTPQTITWNATNVSGTVVPDGTYNVRVEFTWQHGTTATSNTTVSFTKGTSAVHLTPANQTEYTNMVLDWVPAVTAPVASFSASNTSICENNSINFLDQSTNSPTSWAWDFGDGQTANTQNASHTYTTAGTYTVALTATNAGGSNTSTLTNYITVNPTLIPSVSITPSAAIVCPGTSVTFTATPVNGGNPTYSWSVDGNIVGTGNTYSSVFTNGQAVVCTMTSDAACVNPVTATSSTFNTGVYSVNPVTVTETTGTLNSDAASGNQWYEQASGIIAGATGQSYSPTANGDYYSIVTDANGCTSTSNVINYTYIGIPEYPINSTVKIYPNPSKGIINISFDNAVINGQFSIEDFTGKEVYSEKINQKNGSVKTIDLSKYSNGVYFFKLNNQKYKVVIGK